MKVLEALYKSMAPLVKMVLLVLLFGAAFAAGGRLAFKDSTYITVHVNSFEESNIALKNPYRGYYRIFMYYIDDGKMDLDYLLDQVAQVQSPEQSLILVEINLAKFSKGEINEEGLANIDSIFHELTKTGNQWILRFLYDWKGRNQRSEPELSVILGHLEQLEPLIRQYQDYIFTLQGLSVGNWGEMHGTKYDDAASFRILADKYFEITNGEIYMAVRTPRIWRMVSGIDSLENVERGSIYPEKLGLFNDGMFGSATDLGTYWQEGDTASDPYIGRTIGSELAYQNRLCEKVPNGGEAVLSNSRGDFEKALPDLRTMRVTYLNSFYDPRVLNRWKSTRVNIEGCYKGMSGFQYIERHLGYRYFIEDAALEYQREENRISIRADIRNVGFAPIYVGTNCEICLVSEVGEGTRVITYSVPCDLRSLYGGTDEEDVLTLTQDLTIARLPEGIHRVYIRFTEERQDMEILLANEVRHDEYGYEIGNITVLPAIGKYPVFGTNLTAEEDSGDEWDRLCGHLGW